MMEVEQILKSVKNLEITTRRLVDGLVAGNFNSKFKGQGIEFSEIRDYRYGDDIRAIDWNVTARFNHPYIKEYIEERDLRIYVMFDFSASGNFGNIIEKKRKAIEIASALIMSAVRNSDKSGLCLFTEDVEKFIPARKGKKHALKLIRELVTHTPKFYGTNLENAVNKFLKLVKKKSVVFIVSDFFSEDFEKQIGMLNRKHDLVALRVNDKREMELEDVGLIELEDEETGEQVLVDTSDKDFRNAYEKQIDEEEKRLKSIFRRQGVSELRLFTDESHEIALKRFFRSRVRA